jgi:hypothetical protein
MMGMGTSRAVERRDRAAKACSAKFVAWAQLLGREPAVGRPVFKPILERLFPFAPALRRVSLRV